MLSTLIKRTSPVRIFIHSCMDLGGGAFGMHGTPSILHLTNLHGEDMVKICGRCDLHITPPPF